MKNKEKFWKDFKLQQFNNLQDIMTTEKQVKRMIVLAYEKGFDEGVQTQKKMFKIKKNKKKRCCGFGHCDCEPIEDEK